MCVLFGFSIVPAAGIPPSFSVCCSPESLCRLVGSEVPLGLGSFVVAQGSFVVAQGSGGGGK